ncbi:Membrane protein involved in the export of O-antigen and teichoic acid [Granulicella rosea]|uniref:Membrane protein involved in the export of O-antigen and teichoic acid n=1 Tax=Granulicella rosea TaxID=474952 RepID=A0A239EU31_9BACT|nr:oligosaccharide flippase family protein [Granulicella rosea]SNS48107.1 Membrane protein involved in the export of O-antigen and teichoic acid [Granulicella rosea]
MSTETVVQSPPVEIAALESGAKRASLWTVMDYGAGQALRVVNSLLLTHLLVPAAFGQMTLVITLIVGITMLSDVGLGPSVIQSARGDDADFLNTAWTIQVLRSAVLWLIAVLLSWPASRYYHDHTLMYVLPVLALSTLISGFNSTNLMTLSRHMGMKRLFAIDFSTQIFQLVVTVAWAFWRPDVWALVVGNIAANVFKLVLSHNPKLAPGIRNSFRWEKQSVTQIVHFGRWIMLGTAFFFFASQGDRLILGSRVSLTMLGIYGIAFSLSDIPRAIILALSSKVGYPFIAKIIHLPTAEFRQRYLRYRMLGLAAGALLLSTMVNWGDLLMKLYDHRYAEAAWMIPILALGLWHTLLYTTTSPVLFSLGKSKYSAVGNVAYCVTILVGIPLAFHYWGMLGAVIAVAAGDFPFYVVTQFGAVREGIKPLWQDLQMTCLFLALLATGFFLRNPSHALHVAHHLFNR